MKNVFVLVHDDAGQEARLQAALDLVRTFGGHLSCIDVVQVPVLVGDIYGMNGQVALIDRLLKQFPGSRVVGLYRLAGHLSCC